MRPKIGIVGWSTGEGSFGATKPYLEHLSKFGKVVVLTPMGGIISDLDLIVLPGGKDMPTFRYGQVPGYQNSDSDQFKEFFYDNNLIQYIKAGIPVFGTCLGLQQIVVLFGGKLIQNVHWSHGYSNDPEKGGRGELVHKLIFTDKFKKVELEILANRKNSKVKDIRTCSLHHQGVSTKKVPEELDLVAYTDDGIVEAVMHKELPIGALQAHTEEDNNPLGMWMIENLLKRSPNLKNEKQGDTLAVN